jgi:hypothetical protein
MIIYNITDIDKAGKEQPGISVKIRGITISPGNGIEFKEFPKGEISGLVLSNVVAIDLLPSWYQKAKAKIRNAAGKQ